MKYVIEVWPMDEINFNQIKRLWNLKLVVEVGSIKKAATHANVTSSAMSQSISGLEVSIGRKLLLRKKQKLVPTEYGSQLLKSAEPAFGLCFDLQRNLSNGCVILPKIDWLDLATTESLAVDILPEIVKRLRGHYPNIRLKVKSGRSSELTKAVRKAEICMALVEENDYMQGVTAIPIAEERLGFFCSVENSSRKGSDLIESLGVGTLTCGLDGHPPHYTKFLRILGKSVKPTLSSESYEVLRAAAVEGVVVAILPSRVACRKLDDLIEVFPTEKKIASKEKSPGTYRLYLVCEPGCTTEENDFLAMEIKSIISATPLNEKSL